MVMEFLEVVQLPFGFLELQTRASPNMRVDRQFPVGTSP